MDIQQARRIIRNTFESSFDKVKFIDFIKDLLNQYNESKAFHLRGCYIPKAFENIIKSYERIGTYTDSEGKKIDIIIVYLKKETTIDRARTAQRNFIANYLKGRGEKDAGLVAFVSPEEDDWRFSFVKMEYKFEKTPKGDVKVKEEFTAARRYSFLVGKNESSHTAQSCFIDILKNDDYNPTIYELEKAFNIEKVTKEFFEKYRDLFLQIKDSLDEVVKKDEEIRKEFQEKGINTVDFSKKLLGQIVFLYFLQKKGWFGVKEGQKWGSGSKHFLRELFEKKHCDYKNFFNDVLEPLFYEALRNDRSHEDHYFSYFNCKIPFLNGGLFDPINDYDWAKTDILLPDTLFSNQIKTKEGDIGTGILDIFDRYNFTVKEDEPLEKEVAVDPEMLGKVFENLLEVKDRKSKGTYYTPREIVHYMCQQSLINYLYTELSSSVIASEAKQSLPTKDDIEKLIKYGDTTIENDNHVATKGEETKTYSFKLPENIRKNAEVIDGALKNIRVCDPAIGSGAFPVGMMNEIIRARNVLTPYLLLREAEATKQSRTIYNFKRHAIQNCIYGVDIDPGACEIAKLRLWLSLIVDEEDIEQIKPLPNLDYKIMQGNSLISEFMGIDLDNDKQNNEKEKLFSTDETKELYEMLKDKKGELLNQPNTNKKKILKNEIEDLIIKIFEIKLQEQKSDYFRKIREIEEKWKRHPVKEAREKEIKKERDLLYRKAGFNLEEVEKQLRQYTSNQKVRPFFPWKLYFSEVFQEKDGFDVVIANPPYVDYRGIPKKIIKSVSHYKTNINSLRPNLYMYFIEKGFYILKRNGIFVFINPNQFLSTNAGLGIRKFTMENAIIKFIIDVSYIRVFQEAATYTTIWLFVKKLLPDYKIRFNCCNDLNKLEATTFYLSKKEILSDPSFIIPIDQEYKLLRKIEGKRPRLGTLCKMVWGTSKSGYGELKIKKSEYLKLSDRQKAKYKPILQTRDIKRYYIEWQEEYIPEDVYSDNAKHIFGNKKKILIARVTRKLQCAIDNESRFIGKATVLFNYDIDENYLLGILNSNLINYWYSKKYETTHMASRYLRFDIPYLKQIPIIEIPVLDQKPFIEVVDKIIGITKYLSGYDAQTGDDYLINSTKQAEVKEYERQINEMVYKLYGLTEEEIKIIEESIK